MDINILNTEENRKKLSKYLKLDIIDIQLYPKRGTSRNYEVLFFWPHFWWFRHRSRMDLEIFEKLMKEL